MNEPGGFVERLRARKLVQWAVAYLAAAWLFLQVLDFMRENFGWSARLVQILSVIAAAGFLATLVLAWYHGEKGRQRVGRVEFILLLSVLVLGGFGVSLIPRGSEADDEPDYVERGANPSVTMAVLPFDNVSAVDDEGLADGLTLEIASQLSKVSDLRVLARSAVLQAIEATGDRSAGWAEIGAQRLLEGTVQATAEQVRITAQLIDVGTNGQLWADSYTRDITDIFTLQSDIALAIVEALEAELTPDERSRIEDPSTEDLAAFRLFQRQTTLFGNRPEENRLGIQLLEEAVELDPEYAAAWARLGWRYGWEAFLGRTEVLEIARAHAERALEIDPELAAAYHTLASVQSAEGRRASVLTYRRGLELDPSHGPSLNDLSFFLTQSGDLEEALDLGLRGVSVDPSDATTRWHAAIPLRVFGDDERTRRWLERAASEFPEQSQARLDQELAELDLIAGSVEAAREQALSLLQNYAGRPEPERFAAWLLAAASDWEAAGDVIAPHAEETPSALGNFGHAITTRTLHAAALLNTGEPDRAKTLLDESLAYAQQQLAAGADFAGWYVELASVHALSGRVDPAFEALELVFDAGLRHYRQLDVGPAFQELRQDPRFERLLARMERDVDRMRANAERDGLFARVDSILALP